MTEPKGPLGRYGPFVRNAQSITDTMWLVELQRGLKGTGKVWRPAILVLNSDLNAGDLDNNGDVVPTYWQRGHVRVMHGYRAGNYEANLWREKSHVEGVFPHEADAVEFMLYTAKEFLK